MFRVFYLRKSLKLRTFASYKRNTIGLFFRLLFAFSTDRGATDVISGCAPFFIREINFVD